MFSSHNRIKPFQVKFGYKNKKDYVAKSNVIKKIDPFSIKKKYK